MSDKPRLVLSYMGEDVYHLGWAEDEQRPACRPKRIRGIPIMRVRAERDGETPCPLCWPTEPEASGSPPAP